MAGTISTLFNIYEDQNGFVPDQSTSLNLRCLFRVMRYAPQAWPGSGCMVLDVEKAFDTVEWHFVFSVLPRYGLGPHFIMLIKLLYNNPVVRVRTGHMVSQPIPVRRGTRQGCPFPPPSFLGLA